MASQPQANLTPAFILNGKSVHLQAALAHIARFPPNSLSSRRSW
jgi:hypothetical protein